MIPFSDPDIVWHHAAVTEKYFYSINFVIYESRNFA